MPNLDEIDDFRERKEKKKKERKKEKEKKDSMIRQKSGMKSVAIERGDNGVTLGREPIEKERA